MFDEKNWTIGKIIQYAIIGWIMQQILSLSWGLAHLLTPAKRNGNGVKPAGYVFVMFVSIWTLFFGAIDALSTPAYHPIIDRYGPVEARELVLRKCILQAPFVIEVQNETATFWCKAIDAPDVPIELQRKWIKDPQAAIKATGGELIGKGADRYRQISYVNMKAFFSNNRDEFRQPGLRWIDGTRPAHSWARFWE